MRKGFSLLEILLSLSILGVLVGAALTSLKPARAKAGSRALAQNLAGILESARGRARHKNVPVGVGLSSSGGTTPATRGVYLLEGEIKPKIFQVRDLTDRGGVIFSGIWNWDGSPTSTAGGQERGTPGERFFLSDWQAPYSSDPLIVFTPSGAVVSNLPRVDNRFLLVGCDSCQWSATSLAGQPTFRLDSVSSPWTVQVTSGGQIRVEMGLWQGTQVPLRASTTAVVAPTLPRPAVPVNQNPTPPTIQAYPAPVTGALPPGVDALVPIDGSLTLEAVSHDPDGDALTAYWTASGGIFSHSSKTAMQWDREKLHWVSHWVWTPPVGAAPGATYTLTCTISDPTGGTASGRLGVGGRVDTLPSDKLAFEEDVQPTTGPRYECITICNPDGTDRKRLTGPSTPRTYYPNWAPDGQTLAFIDTTARVIYEIRRDGSGLRALVTLPNRPSDIAYRSDGTSLYISTNDGAIHEHRFQDGSLRQIVGPTVGVSHSFTAYPRPPFSLVRSNGLQTSLEAVDPATGSIQAVDTSACSGARFAEPSFSPSGRFYTWGQGSRVFVADVLQTGSSLALLNPRMIVRHTNGVHNPVFSPNEQQLEYQGNDPVPQLWRINADGTQAVKITQTAGDVLNSDDASWSLR